MVARPRLDAEPAREHRGGHRSARAGSGGLVALVALLALVLMAAACASAGDRGAGATSGDGEQSAGDGRAASAAGPVPRMHLGPQGDVPQFVVKCGFSHADTDDPIVHPGHHGASHRHDFFGNRGTDANSTAASLLGGDTSCNIKLDAAAYWAPSLLDRGEPVTPLGSIAYYRPAPGMDATTLEPYPAGLMMVAGDGDATGPQPAEVAAWSCGTSSAVQPTPPTCPAAAPLRVRITFPDCWDGEHVDSPDHRAHVARSSSGRCPASHPVPMPQLTFHIRYPISGGDHELSLATGPLYTAHADFLNAWDQPALTNEVERCLHIGVVCNVASNRAEDEAQPT
jgi:hypothetical protein